MRNDITECVEKIVKSIIWWRMVHDKNGDWCDCLAHFDRIVETMPENGLYLICDMKTRNCNKIAIPIIMRFKTVFKRIKQISRFFSLSLFNFVSHLMLSPSLLIALPHPIIRTCILCVLLSMNNSRTSHDDNRIHRHKHMFESATRLWTMCVLNRTMKSRTDPHLRTAHERERKSTLNNK